VLFLALVKLRVTCFVAVCPEALGKGSSAHCSAAELKSLDFWEAVAIGQARALGLICRGRRSRHKS